MPSQIQHIAGQLWQFCHARDETEFLASEFLAYLVAAPTVLIASEAPQIKNALVFIDRSGASKRTVIRRRSSSFFTRLWKMKLLRVVVEQRGQKRVFALRRPLHHSIWHAFPGVQISVDTSDEGDTVPEEEDEESESDLQQMLMVLHRDPAFVEEGVEDGDRLVFIFLHSKLKASR